MSQNKVYHALKQLDGEVTTTELKEHLKEEYPNSTLHEYATNRLRKLEEREVVEIDDSSRPFKVEVLNENWRGISDSIAERDFPPTSQDDK